VEEQFPTGSLTPPWLSNKRALQGTRGHKDAAEKRKDATPEVGITLDFYHYPVHLILQGRIDLLRETEPEIIEVKTVEQDLPDTADPLHRDQLLLYGYLYSHDRHRDCSLTLLYLSLATGQEKSLSFTMEEAKSRSEEILEGFFQEQFAHISWIYRRNQSLQSLEFPFKTYRPGQREMAAQIFSSLKGGRQILIEAPTGIGKTMAVLLGSLKSLVPGGYQKIFYFTSKGTQKGEVLKALEILNHKGIILRWVTINAKEKMCLNPQNYCRPESCPFAQGYYTRLGKLRPQLLQESPFIPQTLARLGQEHRLCPFELSLDLSLDSDLILCDYNYLFDPRVFLKRYFTRKKNPYALLIEEGHNLVDRFRGMHKPELKKSSFLKARKLFKSLGKKEPEKISNNWNSRFLQWKKALGAREILTIPLEKKEWKPDLRRLQDEIADLNGRSDLREEQDFLETFWQDLVFWNKVLDLADDQFECLVFPLGKNLILQLFLPDISTLLQKKLSRGQGAVFFSASFRPLDYFLQNFGLPRDRAFLCPPVFPPENQITLRVDHLSLLYRNRDKTLPEIARMIASFVKSQRGNYLLFAPSYTYRDKLTPLLEEIIGPTSLVNHPTPTTEDQREGFLAHFTPQREELQIGLTVTGGPFAEGVDLPGDRLIGVIIIGAGLPQLSRETKEIQRHFNFDYAFTYPGINRVLQAAGRLIRTEEDTGSLLLVDHRFKEKSYMDNLPRLWYTEESIRTPMQLEEKIKSFWKSVEERNV